MRWNLRKNSEYWANFYYSQSFITQSELVNSVLWKLDVRSSINFQVSRYFSFTLSLSKQKLLVLKDQMCFYLRCQNNDASFLSFRPTLNKYHYSKCIFLSTIPSLLILSIHNSFNDQRCIGSTRQQLAFFILKPTQIIWSYALTAQTGYTHPHLARLEPITFIMSYDCSKVCLRPKWVAAGF